MDHLCIEEHENTFKNAQSRPDHSGRLCLCLRMATLFADHDCCRNSSRHGDADDFKDPRVVFTCGADLGSRGRILSFRYFKQRGIFSFERNGEQLQPVLPVPGPQFLCGKTVKARIHGEHTRFL